MASGVTYARMHLSRYRLFHASVHREDQSDYGRAWLKNSQERIGRCPVLAATA